MPKMKTIACVRQSLNAPKITKKVRLPKLSIEEKRIGEMLLENTGSHFLDSGGAYRRAWQTNQAKGLGALLKEPRVTVEGNSDGSFWVTKSLMHTLPDLISITKDSEKLQKEFEKFQKNNDNSDFEDAEQFAKNKFVGSSPDADMGAPMTINTYNDSDTFSLSQDIQFTLFNIKDKCFVALQIHGGCDIRGGYTKPKIFEVGSDYFGDFIQGLEANAYDPATQDSASGSDILYQQKENGWTFKKGKVYNKQGKEIRFD